jgi:hypothetical protein
MSNLAGSSLVTDADAGLFKERMAKLNSTGCASQLKRLKRLKKKPRIILRRERTTTRTERHQAQAVVSQKQ